MRLTIFTPTYNRKQYLPVCYMSLIAQTCQDFIWLIIDDGSGDGTTELVTQWQQENKIAIKYIWQPNQGMHGAHNTAYTHITTELNVCIDSDDYMPVYAVEKIISMWDQYGGEHVGGMIGLDATVSGKVIGTMLPDVNQATLYDLHYKHGVTGDKKLVYRSDLTKKYPYPLFENETYVGLAYKYYKLDMHVDMLLMNQVLCHVEYLAEGSSRNMFNQYRNNPKGFSFYRKELIKLPFASLSFRFRQAIHYVSSSMLAKNRFFLKESPAKLLTVFAFPLGVLLWLYIKMRTRSV